MSKIRQILQLYGQGQSHLAICRLTGGSRNTLKKYIRDYKALNLNIVEVEELSDHDLSELFISFKPHQEQLSERAKVLYQLFPDIDKQLRRKGITQQLLWEQYRVKHPKGQSQFSYHYNLWKQQVNPVMHFEHKAGDKAYLDYAGEKLYLVDQETGEQQAVEVFVGILGCSQLTYVEASYTQQKEDLIESCERFFTHLMGHYLPTLPLSPYSCSILYMYPLGLTWLPLHVTWVPPPYNMGTPSVLYGYPLRTSWTPLHLAQIFKCLDASC